MNDGELAGAPGEIRTPDPQIRSLMTPITHPIVRAPMAGRGIVRGARIVAWRLKRLPTQPEAEHRDSRRTLGTSLEPFGEHP